MTQGEITIREAAPGESAIILHHRRSMFRDMGEGTVEESIGWWKLHACGWRGLWLMARIAIGWRSMARAASLAVVGCCCVRGRRIPRTHARSEP